MHVQILHEVGKLKVIGTTNIDESFLGFPFTALHGDNDFLLCPSCNYRMSFTQELFLLLKRFFDSRCVKDMKTTFVCPVQGNKFCVNDSEVHLVQRHDFTIGYLNSQSIRGRTTFLSFNSAMHFCQLQYL